MDHDLRCKTVIERFERQEVTVNGVRHVYLMARRVLSGQRKKESAKA